MPTTITRKQYMNEMMDCAYKHLDAAKRWHLHDAPVAAVKNVDFAISNMLEVVLTYCKIEVPYEADTTQKLLDIVKANKYKVGAVLPEYFVAFCRETSNKNIKLANHNYSIYNEEDKAMYMTAMSLYSVICTMIGRKAA